MYEVFIPLEPVAASRPRVTLHGTFYSKKYNDYKKQAQKLIVGNIIDGPVEAHIIFYMPIPKSTPKKDLPFMEGGPHIKRPDIDNMVKAALDILNGRVLRDDGQVYRLTAEKVYSSKVGTRIILNEG